jgi:hypothetical protein
MIEFKMIFEGEESFKNKFEKALQDNDKLHIQIMTSFGHAIMNHLKLDDTDNVRIVGFRAGECWEKGNKKVDN